MFKKFIVLFFLLFLVSCWSSDETVTTTDTSEWLISQEKTDFSIEIPETWEEISNSWDVLPTPNEWKIELVVSAKTQKSGFKNNLLILSDALGTFTTSKDFSILNNIWASRDYIDYNLLESKDIKFLDEEISLLYIFEAKYNLESPKLKFLQTSHICNQTKAFFFTIAIPTSTKDTSKYEDLLKTFKCK